MTEILLIRHGQSANNALLDHQRVCDPGLTERGVQQAEATAKTLFQVPITRLFCSPFLRSLETMRPIAEGRSLAVEVNANIFEQGGCYNGHDAVGRTGAPGMGFSKLQRLYPGWMIDSSIPEAGWWGRDFESAADAHERAVKVASWITSELVPAGGNHTFVIHADFKYLLIHALLAQHSSVQATVEVLNNVGITRFEWTDDRWALTSLNSVSHLPAELVT